MPRQTEITNDQKAGRRNFFQEWRKHRGLTQQQVADRMETTRSSGSRRERGLVSDSQDYLEVLADGLQTDAAALKPHLSTSLTSLCMNAGEAMCQASRARQYRTPHGLGPE